MADAATNIRVDPDTGAVSVDDEEGGSLVYLNPPKEPEPEQGGHFENLAGKLDAGVRGAIVEECMRGYEADEESRRDWLETRAEGIKMLGINLEKPSGDAGNSSQPFEGMSTIRHPLLMEAITRAQANAAAELYPPSGPVKVRDDRPVKPAGVIDQPGMGHNGGPPLEGENPVDQEAISQVDRDELAEALQRGFNHNLTVVDRGYRPDSVRMLFYVFFDGCAFKKVYDCPIRERPMSRFVPASDIVVANGVSDHRDAGRLTHVIRMRPSVVKRMQIAGVYRDTELPTPQFTPNAVDEATAEAQGLQARPTRQEDQPYTMLEMYVELDIPGYEHERKEQKTGLPLPWKVTIDKDSREMLELRRNWDEDDDTYQQRETFVKFGFIPALGFYDLGFLHLLGNGDKALTATWREALDTGMFGNFPGFMYNEGVIRNWTNQNRIPPGGGLGIKGLPPNVPLRNVLEPLPYKDVSMGLVGMIQHVEQRMDRIAGTGQLPIAEGNQEMPVGTTLALLETAMKVIAGAHVGLHASQAEELQLLKDRYKDNPESFWRWNKKGYKWEEEEFLQALEDCELTPAADPNTASHTLRIARAQAVLMVAQQAPMLFKLRATARQFLSMIGISNPDSFLVDQEPDMSQQQPPADPAKQAAVVQKQQQAEQEHAAKMAELGQKAQTEQQQHQDQLQQTAADSAAQQQDRQLAALAQATESADRAADRASRERIATIKAGTERTKLAEQSAQQHADRQHEAVQGQVDREHQAQEGHMDRTSAALQQAQKPEGEEPQI